MTYMKEHSREICYWRVETILMIFVFIFCHVEDGSFVHAFLIHASSIYLSKGGCSFTMFHFLQCVSSNGCANCLSEKMQSCTRCICIFFLQCAFSNVCSNRLHKRIQSHTGCICLSFPHCGFSNVYSRFLPENLHSRIDCICLTLLHCVLSSVSSNGML